MLQIPAFLCRQTDLIVAAARTGKVIFVLYSNKTVIVNDGRDERHKRNVLTSRNILHVVGKYVWHEDPIC